MQRVLSWDWRWILAALLLVFVLLLVLRQPLANWLWPQTRAERLHERAARALAQGKLTAPDGTGARELYSAALAAVPACPSGRCIPLSVHPDATASQTSLAS